MEYMPGYPTTLQKEVSPLPVKVDQKTLNDKGLYVMQGLTKALVGQLIARSREPHIIEYCPNDAAKRFKNVDTAIAWQAKGRLAFPLVKKNGTALRLVGMGWIGPKQPGSDEPHLPGAKTTFSIRIYKDALGQGNALPYAQTILAAHKFIYGNGGMWLESWGDNISAAKTYQKAGFVTVAKMQGTRHGNTYPRIYMMLDDTIK